MAQTYAEAQQRALQLNLELKHSSSFARPVRDKESLFGWNVEIVDSKELLKQHEKNETFRTD